MADKLLIIGAGIGQVHLVEMAKSRGVHTVVVSIPGDYPAFQIADESWFLDIYDVEGIVARARENGITAVLSDQNDLVMPTVAYVAERLGLPGNSVTCAEAYCNKNNFRDNCDILGIPQPAHRKIKFDDIVDDIPISSVEGLRFPLVVKPANSQSSIGVKVVDNEQEFFAALMKAMSLSRSKEAIVEEFFSGHEVVCEGYIDNGVYHNLMLGDRTYFELKNLAIPSMTLFPALLSEEVAGKIISCEEQIAKHNMPAFGIVHSEYLVGPDEETICIVESALRGGGVGISSHLVPATTGIDINEWLLAKALGSDAPADDFRYPRKSGSSGYVCFSLKPGIITEIRGLDEVSEAPFVDMVCLSNVAVGLRSEPLTHKGRRLGPFLISGSDRAELCEHIEWIKDTFEIMIENEDGEIEQGIVWA